MTGERELAPEGERSAIVGGEDEVWSVGPDWDRSGTAAPGAKKPTWRTFGSLTVRGARRGSMVRTVTRTWKGKSERLFCFYR